MTKLEEYADTYETVRMERRDGILQVTFHTGDGSLKFGLLPHRELVYAFADIGSDPDNRVVILTGAGDDFIAEIDGSFPPSVTPQSWDAVYWEGQHLIKKLLDIEVPVIGAVNGPALIHAEIAVLSNIVLAAETAVFQDWPHFPRGLVPGDGVHVIWPLLLGHNRGSYFLLTGQKLSAREALDLGVVNEVLPKERLLPRAWELAELLAQQPTLTLRYTRVALTLHIKRMMQDALGLRVSCGRTGCGRRLRRLQWRLRARLKMGRGPPLIRSIWLAGGASQLQRAEL